MEEFYHSMMCWALGDDYINHDVKKAPQIWASKHPDLPQLKVMKDKPAGANAYYFIFQITNYWLEIHETKESHYGYKENNEQVRAVYATSFTSFIKSIFMQLFKRKARSSR